MKVGNAGNLTRCEKNQNFLCNGSTARLLQTLRGSEKMPCCSSILAHIVPCIRVGKICGMQMPQTRKMSKLPSVHCSHSCYWQPPRSTATMCQQDRNFDLPFEIRGCLSKALHRGLKATGVSMALYGSPKPIAVTWEKVRNKLSHCCYMGNTSSLAAGTKICKTTQTEEHFSSDLRCQD